MTRPTLLSSDPTARYNVAVPAAHKGGPPTYPLRNLVGALRATVIGPWLQESSLEDVVTAWLAIHRAKDAADAN